MRAIEHAHRIISLLENLREEEMPPDWMWPFDERMESWLARVKADRTSGAQSGSSSPDEEVPMMENEYAQRFK